jgi:hypothetical protein
MGALLHGRLKVTPNLTVNRASAMIISASRSIAAATGEVLIRSVRTPCQAAQSRPSSDSAGEGGGSLFSNKNGLFCPRGIAYRSTSGARAGSGWFDNSAHFNVYTILNLTRPTPPVSSSRRSPRQPVPTPVFTPGSFVLRWARICSTDPRRPAANLYAVDPNRQNDTHWQWSADIQRALPLGTALTIGYGEQNDQRLSIMSYWNAAQPSPNTDFQSRRPYGYFYDPSRPHRFNRPGRSKGSLGLNNHYEGLTVSSIFERTGVRLNYTYSLAYGQAPVLRIPTDKTQTTWPMDEAAHFRPEEPNSG